VVTYVSVKYEGGVTNMPNIKSAKKRVLVNKTKAQRNKSANSALKTAIKKANVAIETNAADKNELVKVAVKKIDQAAAKGLLHKNNAARKKSALVTKLNKA
jgi:small subunit ribosomal protein S20